MSWPALVLSVSTLAAAACGSPQATDPERPQAQNLERELAPGQSLQSGAVRVTFKSVDGDSRCPEDVVCVWEGDALVKIELREGSGDAVARDLHTSGSVGAKSTAFGGLEISLVRLSPTTHSQRPISAQDYRVVLRIRQP
jgi:hypothetical protein